jgi:hypothetical protein
MGDGHTGTRIEYVSTKSSHNFLLALTHLEEKHERAWCVLHVHSKVAQVTGHLSPGDFLRMLGFQQYEATCPALRRPCYFKYSRQLHAGTVGSKLGVPEFVAFVDSIQGWYEEADQLARSVGDHSHFVRWGTQFSTEPEALDIQGQEPQWMESSRIEGHQAALDTLAEAEASEKRFRTIESCLYLDGPDLEAAVQYTLSDLDLDAHKTVKGEHVDLILDYPPKGLQIGIEVTGVTGSVDAGTTKLNQVNIYLEECRNSGVACKGLILANTHKGVAPSMRGNMQDFTETLVKAMKGPNIVGLTAADLCRIWEDVKYHGCEISTVIDAICDHQGGVYTYPQ